MTGETLAMSSVTVTMRQLSRGSIYLCSLLMLAPATALAQELVPRAFWPSPVGTNVVSLSYQRSQGDIVVDPSLPVTGVDSEIDYLQFSYQRSFDLGGRTATGAIIQTFSDGETTGEFQGDTLSRRTVGAGDTVFRLAVNLWGAPAMDGREFAALRADPRPIVGASLSVVAPTGGYDSDRLINIGGNRWVIKPGVGVIYPLTSTWLLEAEFSVAFFQDNDDFLSQTREQEPVGNAQLHLIKRFGRGFWAALDANYYGGGRTRVEGQRNQDLQRNSRFGATLVYPLVPGHALRFSGSIGTVTETGGDFDLLSVAWIHAF